MLTMCITIYLCTLPKHVSSITSSVKIKILWRNQESKVLVGCMHPEHTGVMGDFRERMSLDMALEGYMGFYVWKKGGACIMAEWYGRVKFIQGRVRNLVSWKDELGKLCWNVITKWYQEAWTLSFGMIKSNGRCQLGRGKGGCMIRFDYWNRQGGFFRSLSSQTVPPLPGRWPGESWGFRLPSTFRRASLLNASLHLVFSQNSSVEDSSPMWWYQEVKVWGSEQVTRAKPSWMEWVPL